MRIKDPDRRSEDIWQRIQRAVGPNMFGANFLKPRDFLPMELDKHELKLLHNYARKHIDPNAQLPYFSWDEPAKPLKPKDPFYAELFYDILTSPIDRSTYQGRDRERIRQVFGITTRVDTMVSMAAAQEYGHYLLKDALVLHNGHATSQTFSLFPMLAALGLQDGALKTSMYSGNVGLPPLLKTSLIRTLGTSGQVDLSTGDDYIKRLEESHQNPVICVNAGPILAGKSLSPKLLARIERGEIRFILHNQADIDAMQKLLVDDRARQGLPPIKPIIINLALSKAKELEAQVIGEQWAVLASDNCLRHCGTPLRNGIAIVKGYGILGKSVVKGLEAMGYDPKQIYLIETDEARREQAIADGCPHVFASIPEECSKAEAAAVIVATNRTGFFAADVDNLPMKSTVMALTSNGEGIDVEGVRARFGREAQTYLKTGVGGGLSPDSIMTDLHFGGFSDSSRKLTMVNCRQKDGKWLTYPQNLVKPIGQQRLVTSAMLLLAIAQAARTTEVGVHDIDPASIRILQEALDKYRVKGREPSLIKGLTPEIFAAAVDALACVGPHEPDEQLLARARRLAERDPAVVRSLRFGS